MIKAIIVGYGNIGQYAHQAIRATADMELVGIIDPSLTLAQVDGISVGKTPADFGKVDVAIIGAPSRAVPSVAIPLLEAGIATVDSYDIHGDIYEQQQLLAAAAKKGGCASIIAAGWDPGTDSVVRALFEAMTPRGITYTNFGPGMSMGHSVAAKSIEGVQDALSMTIPLGTGVHRRMVYITPEDGQDFDQVAARIKADDYFKNDDTHVIQASCIDTLKDVGHSVQMERKGVSGETHAQKLGFNMSINNPALTAQVLVSCARAVLRQQPGCYTLIEIPLIDLLPGSREDAIRRLV